jgi:hypothetical protein
MRRFFGWSSVIPLALVDWSPAYVGSLIISRSNSASAPKITANIYPDPLHVVQADRGYRAVTGHSRGLGRMFLQDVGYEFPRKLLSGNLVHRGSEATT